MARTGISILKLNYTDSQLRALSSMHVQFHRRGPRFDCYCFCKEKEIDSDLLSGLLCASKHEYQIIQQSDHLFIL